MYLNGSHSPPPANSKVSTCCEKHRFVLRGLVFARLPFLGLLRPCGKRTVTVSMWENDSRTVTRGCFLLLRGRIACLPLCVPGIIVERRALTCMRVRYVYFVTVRSRANIGQRGAPSSSPPPLYDAYAQTFDRDWQ